MSDMLEQAIIDAEALKTAATRNAETLVLEKYSDQIKDAVEILLEQEEPDAAGMMDMALGGAGAEPVAEDPAGDAATPPSEQTKVLEHIPLAAISDVSDDEEIEIPLENLLGQINNLNESLRWPSGDNVNDPDLFEGNVEEDLLFEEEDLMDEDYSSQGHGAANTAGWPHGRPGQGETLAERTVVDLDPLNLRGWSGLPDSEFQLAEEELLALEQDSKVREEKKELRKAVKELDIVNETVVRENKKLTTTLNKSTKFITKLRNAILVLEEKLDKVSLDNAKLLYHNKALTSDSLNERQKQKLAEAVVNADSIEEARVIFETLQNTVGSTSRKQQPKSLSEAVQKSSSMILKARKENSSTSNPTLDRWKFLAGIDKK